MDNGTGKRSTKASTVATPAMSSSEFLAHLTDAHTNGDVPTAFNTRLASDPEPWSLIHVVVTYVSPILNDTIYLIADGSDGQGRVIVIADGQDLTEARGWLSRGTVRLAGRRTDLLGTVGFDIRRMVA